MTVVVLADVIVVVSVESDVIVVMWSPVLHLNPAIRLSKTVLP